MKNLIQQCKEMYFDSKVLLLLLLCVLLVFMFQQKVMSIGADNITGVVQKHKFSW